MEYKVRKICWTNTLLLLIPLMIIACTSGSDMNSPSQQKLGDSVEGRYTVTDDGSTIGHLTLENGKYVFSAVKGVTISKLVADRLYFVSHPSGKYYIEYWPSFDQNTILADLANDEIIIAIGFGGEAPIDNRFFIRNNTEGNRFYFHSLYNEFHLWGIGKAWND